MGAAQIDVWNVETFDATLRRDLDAHAGLIGDYLQTSRRLMLEREASTRLMEYPENPYAQDYINLKERLMSVMDARTIRGWHYTRMTDAEVDRMQQEGVHLATLETIRSRLAAQVAAGAMTQGMADQLFADSPFKGEQHAARSGKFWMVSHPVNPVSSGVRPLLGSWGGEATYFWQQEPDLRQLLRSIGRPRVLEVAVPLAQTRHSYRAAEAVVAAYARSLDCRPEEDGFDLFSEAALGPDAILAIHSEGDESFVGLARGYPKDYIERESDGHFE